ncbi:hypothetical protein [Kineosporia sp. NBRC 101731]|uniref:hypothetical protein n=1 Tax=Kineosporia sp. NBRC 101731 TaxID=3032199 RepID=UPI0024A188FB|nr:hypothetical protein [Kineosporia sp. NBRC 101731]GLY33877.1 hypothetical protein Kisp02_72420 [Kineosporia sp. NBRC 101731]
MASPIPLVAHAAAHRYPVLPLQLAALLVWVLALVVMIVWGLALTVIQAIDGTGMDDTRSQTATAGAPGPGAAAPHRRADTQAARDELAAVPMPDNGDPDAHLPRT